MTLTNTIICLWSLCPLLIIWQGELFNDIFLNNSTSKTVKDTSEIYTQESSLKTAEIVT